MITDQRLLSVLLLASVFSVDVAKSQTPPQTGLYQIISGTYTECCGLAGESRSALPNDQQSFLKLTVDSQGQTAAMTLLGKDMKTVFSVFVCPPGSPAALAFDQGVLVSNRIEFVSGPGDPDANATWDYSVSRSGGALQLDGMLRTLQGFCLDVPDRFTHSNVVAVLMPSATIRVSEVEICWDTLTNMTYQVQYRSALTTNAWMDLGTPVPGDGSTNCVTDPVPAGQPRRFYRVITVP